VSDDPESGAPRTDAELIEAARQGDAAAFETLYRRYRDWTVRLARRWCGNDTDASDVLQEAFLWVLGKLPELELRVRFTTLLFPVVRNLAWRRRKARRPEVLEDAPESAVADDPPAHSDDLAHVLGSLPEAQRAVVLLRFVDDLPLADVAARLCVPVGTVKSRLHQALRLLREDGRTRRYFLGDP